MPINGLLSSLERGLYKRFLPDKKGGRIGDSLKIGVIGKHKNGSVAKRLKRISFKN